MTNTFAFNILVKRIILDVCQKYIIFCMEILERKSLVKISSFFEILYNILTEAHRLMTKARIHHGTVTTIITITIGAIAPNRLHMSDVRAAVIVDVVIWVVIQGEADTVDLLPAGAGAHHFAAGADRQDSRDTEENFYRRILLFNFYLICHTYAISPSNEIYAQNSVIELNKLLDNINQSIRGGHLRTALFF